MNASKRKPSNNGHAHNGHAHNGHAPTSRLAGIVPPPIDTVPHGDQEKAKPAEQVEAKPQEGRSEKGTFAPGNKFSRGNPTARRMCALRSALLRNLTAEKLDALGEKLYQSALSGDWVAAKLLLAYAVGKAPDAVNADRLDLDEWKILDAAPTPPQVSRAFIDVIPPALASEYLQLLAPADKAALMKKLSLVSADDENDEDEAQHANAQTAMRIHDERKARIGK